MLMYCGELVRVQTDPWWVFFLYFLLLTYNIAFCFNIDYMVTVKKIYGITYY